MKYQTKQAAIEAAQTAGSSAKTFKGASKFLISRSENHTPLHQRGKSTHEWNRGAKHRLDYLKNRPAERMLAKGTALCRAFGLWTLDDAQEAAESAHTRMMDHRRTIPLGEKSSSRLRGLAYAEYPQRQNWETPKPTKDVEGWYVNDIDNGNYSSRCTYKHWTYRPQVGCWASLRPSGTLEFCYGGGPEIYLAPPRGYRWDADKNGIRLISLTDARIDYHPDSDDLLNYDGRSLAKKARELFAQRQAAAKKAREEMRLEALSADERTRLIAKAEREGCMVCMADALKAGNCKAGCMDFAERHHLDPAKHYRPSQLLRIANGSADRVKLTVAAALRRHRHEMSVGFCELAHHQA